MDLNSSQKLIVLLLLTSFTVFGQEKKTAPESFHHIRNDIFWNSVDGKPIYSQGGGIFRFPDPMTGVEKYYWYGVRYKEAETYRNDPSLTMPTSTFQSVTCYSSTNLVDWTFENDVLDSEELRKHVGDNTAWVGRLGVAYIKEMGKYAMIVQHGTREKEPKPVLITVSDSPTGKFQWHHHFSMMERIGTANTGDQTVFTDEDSGKSYLVYSYGRGRNKIYLSEIGVKDGKIDLLDCVQIFRGEGREGNCMFKYKGKYYMCASNLYGWDSSYAYYLVAENIYGPYLPVNDMKIMDGCREDYAHITQTGFFVTVKGSKEETVVYCGDRWCDFAGNGLGYNQWFPLSFDGDQPYFNSLSSWNLNAATGEWKVAADNNYVKNGSFEADRNRIPSARKPVQEQLLGWQSTVIAGNRIAVGDSLSPVLNYFNTRDDRKVVIGEKSLNISDRLDFKRTVHQVISSSPYVTLEDGNYTLSAKVQNRGKFNKLEMYALSGKKEMTYDFKTENAQWTTITIKNIAVKNGRIEIGFRAAGAPYSYCHVDDVVLIKNS